MLICTKESCTCSHHQLLECLHNGRNNEAKTILKSRMSYFTKLTDKFGSTLLHISTNCGNAEMTQYLIEGGMNIDIEDNFGVTPLMMAVTNNKLAIIEVLLENNVNIYFTNRYGHNAWKFAARFLHSFRKKEHDNIIHLFIDQVNKDFLANNAIRMQLLLSADESIKLIVVAIGSIEVAKFLIDNDCTTNYRVNDKKAINWAMICEKPENFALLLIECNNNISDTADGFSHYYKNDTIKNDEQTKILQIWLKHVANKLAVLNERNRNAVNRELENLLRYGNKEIVREVLKSEINVAAMRFNSGSTFLHLLILNEHADVTDSLEDLNIDFNVNAQMSDGNTALMLAAYVGSVEKIEFLARLGANFNFTTINGDSAFIRALKSGGVHWSVHKLNYDEGKICELLLQYGADVQLVADNGKSILDIIFVEYNGYHKIVKNVILAHLAMLEAVDRSQLTERTRSLIESQPSFKTQFESYAKQLFEMKNCKLYDEVTLFKLLTTKEEEQLMTYARNPQLNLSFEQAMERMTHLESYYLNILEKMRKAVDQVNLMRKAASAIEVLTGFCSVTHYAIIYNIIRYLSHEDLDILSKEGRSSAPKCN